MLRKEANVSVYLLPRRATVVFSLKGHQGNTDDPRELQDQHPSLRSIAPTSIKAKAQQQNAIPEGHFLGVIYRGKLYILKNAVTGGYVLCELISCRAQKHRKSTEL